MSQQSSTSRVARLLTMVPWLLAHQGVSIEEAAREFGLSPEALESDLLLLFLCGTPGGMPDDLIEAEWETGRIYVGNAETIARPLRLSLEESLSLIVALRAIEATGQLHDAGVVASTLAKLEAATGDAARPRLDDAGRRIHVHVADEAESARLAQLQQALAARRRVRMAYLVVSRDELTHRDVDPMRLFAQDGHWYLEAFCRRADGVRLFRLDRIEHLEILDVDGTPPQRAHARDLDAGVYQGTAGDTLVELELSPAARWVADYYPHESFQDVPVGVGGEQPAGAPSSIPSPAGGTGHETPRFARLVLRVSDPAWVRRLLWRLGGDARVVGPVWLAREVEQGARSALLAYRADM